MTYEMEQAADTPGSSQGDNGYLCTCGHDYWDHLALTDMARSGGGGPCRFKTCDCDEFIEGEED